MKNQIEEWGREDARNKYMEKWDMLRLRSQTGQPEELIWPIYGITDGRRYYCVIPTGQFYRTGKDNKIEEVDLAEISPTYRKILERREDDALDESA